MAMTTITVTTITITTTMLAERVLLRLFQLSSAALPIGAFAYSQALEQAVALGDVTCEASALSWISGILRHSLLRLDLPVLARLYAALSADDAGAVRRWNDYLFAARGSAELRAEERQVGAALARLLARQGIIEAEAWRSDARVTLATGFALAGVAWSAPTAETALAYVFAWAEAQVGAATRLIPLGQTEAQRVLAALIEQAADRIAPALLLRDSELCSSTPGQALLSALHESQYSRLFRS
jgi:urease accessory protein